ncbi:MAG: hypothetical protein LBG60_04365 [Bifidobacteriaceae bacterium]|jgi:hypothetical protein|nr:hypothetical protein [Bifidobacteriaceae bacterium]
MAAFRPVIYIENGSVRKTDVSFAWAPGFTGSQRRVNVKRLHDTFLARRPDSNVLEISSVSGVSLGRSLSATALPLATGATVEGVFQGSKVFAAPGGEIVGPFPELFGSRGTRIKGALRDLLSQAAAKSGAAVGELQLSHFEHGGRMFGLSPEGAFYNWVYVQALADPVNAARARALKGFDAFTDIFFNPRVGYQSQAVAAALYLVFEARHGPRLPKLAKDFEWFLGAVHGEPGLLAFDSIHAGASPAAAPKAAQGSLF